MFLKTPAGTVVHTGDFKLDQTPIDGVTPDYGAIARFGKQGVDLLLSDSTNATVPGFTKSEAEVGPSLLHIIKNAKGRVFVASFSSISIVCSRFATPPRSATARSWSRVAPCSRTRASPVSSGT